MSLRQHVPRFCRTGPERHIRRRYKMLEERDSNPWIKPRLSKSLTDNDDENVRRFNEELRVEDQIIHG
jgi:hypothetical protein